MPSRNVTTVAILLPVLVVVSLVTLFIVRANETEWRKVKDKIYPQFVEVTHKERINILTRPFSPRVDIAFVIDGEEQYTFITEDILKVLAISEDRLYDKALDNLERLSSSTEVEVAELSEEKEGEKYVIVERNDGYSAIRLLSRGFRRAIAKELDADEYIAAIPTRDFLIFWPIEFPLKEAFAQQVKEEFRLESELVQSGYSLTPDLFVVSGRGIQPVRVEEVPPEEAAPATLP